MESRNNSKNLSGPHAQLAPKNPYTNTMTRSNDEDEGLTMTGTNNGVQMMREIPSEAAFQINGQPGGINDPANDENAGWGSKRQFILTIISYSVGLGNIWRFPYLCQQNGGGAFLIPFLVMVIIEGAPLLLIELGIGQRLRQGSLGVWNMIHPSIGGIGIASTVVAFLVGLYYNVIITWCFYFIFNSFRLRLPWADCPMTKIELNGTSKEIPVPECEKSSETAYFWYRTALDISPSIEETGGIKWWMLLCLLLAWVVIYFIIMRGIQSSGNVVYFTALFPYAVLTIFFIRGITLPGAGVGLIHMYTPKMEMLLKPSTWLAAATQVFYSFGLAFGSLIAFGSYNKSRNNCVQDVAIITFANAITAIYASVVIFSILGFKATVIHERCIKDNTFAMHNYNATGFPDVTAITEQETFDFIAKEFDNGVMPKDFRNCSLEGELNSAAAGTGLAFVVFTQAIVELPGAPLWSLVFFMMLLALGIGSQIGTMEGVVNTIFESSYFNHVRKEILTGAICGISFLGGLIFVTGAGEYWVSLFDGYASTTGLVIIAFLETISVMYIYGHKRFSQDIEYMTGTYPGLYWQLTWRFIGPIAMVLILIGSVFDKIQNNPTYSAWNAEKGEAEDKEFPGWTMGIALFLITMGILPIIIVLLMNVFNILPPSGRPRSTSTTMRRIDTAASTRPMMEDYEVAEYRGDMMPEDASDDLMEPLRMAPKSFRMEVIDC